jgi:hypothetical protein
VRAQVVGDLAFFVVPVDLEKVERFRVHAIADVPLQVSFALTRPGEAIKFNEPGKLVLPAVEAQNLTGADIKPPLVPHLLAGHRGSSLIIKIDGASVLLDVYLEYWD